MSRRHVAVRGARALGPGRRHEASQPDRRRVRSAGQDTARGARSLRAARLHAGRARRDRDPRPEPRSPGRARCVAGGAGRGPCRCVDGARRSQGRCRRLRLQRRRPRRGRVVSGGLDRRRCGRRARLAPESGRGLEAGGDRARTARDPATTSSCLDVRRWCSCAGRPRASGNRYHPPSVSGRHQRTARRQRIRRRGPRRRTAHDARRTSSERHARERVGERRATAWRGAGAAVIPPPRASWPAPTRKSISTCVSSGHERTVTTSCARCFRRSRCTTRSSVPIGRGRLRSRAVRQGCRSTSRTWSGRPRPVSGRPGTLGRPCDAAIDHREGDPPAGRARRGQRRRGCCPRALSRLWGGAPLPLLREVAAGLGADVPFFLSGGTALGLGRGEEIYPLVDLPSHAVVIVRPPFGVSTAEAYAWYTRTGRRACGSQGSCRCCRCRGRRGRHR